MVDAKTCLPQFHYEYQPAAELRWPRTIDNYPMPGSGVFRSFAGTFVLSPSEPAILTLTLRLMTCLEVDVQLTIIIFARFAGSSLGVLFTLSCIAPSNGLELQWLKYGLLTASATAKSPRLAGLEQLYPITSAALFLPSFSAMTLAPWAP